MGWFDGWPFKSREQQARERREFENRVMPLGDAQREAALAVLREGTDPKLRDEERLFAFIAAKDAFAVYGGEEDIGREKAKKVLEQQKWLSEPERRFILAFIQLEARAPSLEDYPTAEMVRQSLSARGEDPA